MIELQMAMPVERRFALGACLSISLAVFRRNLLPFLALGLIIGLPGLLFSIFNASGSSGASSENYTGAGTGTYIDMFANALIAATVVYGTFQDLRGSPADFKTIFSRGTSSIVRVLLASLLGSLAILLAGLLLIIPGIIVAIMIWVYIPAIVVEKAGITGSFGRSSDLTKGHRWAILGIMLILFAAYAVALVAIYFIIPAEPVGSSLAWLQASIILQNVLVYIAAALYGVISAITSTVGYYLLRAEKEGIDIDEIAKVFD